MSVSFFRIVMVGVILISLTACGQATTVPNLPTVTPLNPVTTTSQTITQTSSPIPTIPATSTPSVSGKVAMTVYTGPSTAFTFSYPKDWSVNQNEKDSVALSSPATLDARANYAEGVKNQTMPADTPAISTDVFVSYYSSIDDEPINKSGKLGAKNLTELFRRDDGSEVIGDTVVDGLPAKAVLWDGMPPIYKVYISKGTGIYVVSFPKSESEDTLTPEQRSILLSLKLLK